MNRFNYEIAQAHISELHRQAAAERMAKEARRARPSGFAASRRVISNLQAFLRLFAGWPRARRSGRAGLEPRAPRPTARTV